MQYLKDILDDSLDWLVALGMVVALAPFMRTGPAPIQPEEQARAYQDHINAEDYMSGNWNIIEENPDGSDTLLEEGLTQVQAEDILCIYLNYGFDAYLQECDHNLEDKSLSTSRSAE